MENKTNLTATSEKDQNNRRPIVFFAVGIINTLIDFFFYTFLTQFIFTDASKIGIAGLVSGFIAFIFAFMTHRFITWKERPASKDTILRFIVFTGFGLWVLRPLLLAGFIKLTGLYEILHKILIKMGLPFDYSFVMNTGAFGLMVLIVLVYNYFVYDRFVFKKQK